MFVPQPMMKNWSPKLEVKDQRSRSICKDHQQWSRSPKRSRSIKWSRSLRSRSMIFLQLCCWHLRHDPNNFLRILHLMFFLNHADTMPLSLKCIASSCDAIFWWGTLSPLYPVVTHKRRVYRAPISSGEHCYCLGPHREEYTTYNRAALRLSMYILSSVNFSLGGCVNPATYLTCQREFHATS